MTNGTRRIRTTFPILLLLLGSCASLFRDQMPPLLGKPAPDITIKTVDNRQLKISELKGSVILLDFWATWCPPCQKSLPHLNEIAGNQGYSARGLKVIAIDSREDAHAVRDYLAKNNLSLAAALDEDGSAGREFQIQALPTTIIIGRDGTIENILTATDDSTNDAQLDAAIASALAN